MNNTTIVIPHSREVAVETTITITECAGCGVTFGIGLDFEKRRRDDHQSFYCPNGHSLSFPGKTELEKERDRLKRDAEYEKSRADAWKDQAVAAENARRGQKAANTKLKKRIAAGVCPCCHRSFANVERHMTGQHPGYAQDADA